MMNIDELMNKIRSAGSKNIPVEQLSVKAGNPDGSGNYDLLKITIGNEELYFNNKSGTWTYGQ